MPDILLEHARGLPVGRQQVEYVERKGIGHPDTICDGVMEAVSLALSHAYLEAAGRVLHNNVDKALLVAGASSPALGGGNVEKPMRLILSGRATAEYGEAEIPVGEIAKEAAGQWLREHLRFVEPARHVLLECEIHGGSAELADIFARGQVTANDTSAAVGYAPLSETERLVLAAERRLNSPEFKQRFPESGEDVKVMGVRRGRRLNLTVALAFVDRFLNDSRAYFERKEAVRSELEAELSQELETLDAVELAINTLDDRSRGLDGMYLTVLGTSAESADEGEVGRGNRVNGLISFHRPMTLEAAAGKNPVSHVGKVYNLLSHHVAGRIYEAVEPVEEVCLWLVSRIGSPLEEPWLTSAQLKLADGVELGDVEGRVQEIIERDLAAVRDFTDKLVRGDLRFV